MASTPEERAVELTLRTVDSLMKMFRTERVIYLTTAAGAWLLLGYAAFLMINENVFDMTKAALLFGAGGLFTISSVRAVRYLDRSYNLVEDVLRRSTGTEPYRGQ